jgi:hypothetical protein
MRRIVIAIGLLSITCLAGCSLTLPVRGSMENSDEKFTGTATGELDGAGTLHLVSSAGRTCDGTFVYVNRRQGEGTVECTDGVTGTFSFVSTGNRGTGSGTLRGSRFTFVFGG